MRTLVFWTCLIALGFTETAWAWGPATHIGLGSALLDQLHLLPAYIAWILRKHASAFLFGNIAADVVFAKRLSRIRQFCHHWSTGLRLLTSAPDDHRKAFAYGYLSHLAADTVAHGKFVPRQVLVSDSPVNFGHLYWELRADGLETNESWRRLRQILDLDHRDHHESLKPHMQDTFLPYTMNRLLFHRVNTLVVKPQFRRSMTRLRQSSRWPLARNLMQEYRSECVERMCSVLVDGERSGLMREDPNGTSALMKLSVHRRHMRRLHRRGYATKARMRETALGFDPSPKQNESVRLTPAT